MQSLQAPNAALNGAPNLPGMPEAMAGSVFGLSAYSGQYANTANSSDDDNDDMVTQLAPSVDGLAEIVRHAVSGEMRGLLNILMDYLQKRKTHEVALKRRVSTARSNSRTFSAKYQLGPIIIFKLQKEVADCDSLLIEAADTLKGQDAEIEILKHEKEDMAQTRTLCAEEHETELQGLRAQIEKEQELKAFTLTAFEQQKCDNQDLKTDLRAAIKSAKELDPAIRDLGVKYGVVDKGMQAYGQHEGRCITLQKLVDLKQSRLDTLTRNELALNEQLAALQRKLTKATLEVNAEHRTDLEHRLTEAGATVNILRGDLESALSREAALKLRLSRDANKYGAEPEVTKKGDANQQELNAKMRLWDRNSRVLSIVAAYMSNVQEPASQELSSDSEALSLDFGTLSTLKTARTAGSVTLTTPVRKGPEAEFKLMRMPADTDIPSPRREASPVAHLARSIFSSTLELLQFKAGGPKSSARTGAQTQKAETSEPPTSATPSGSLAAHLPPASNSGSLCAYLPPASESGSLSAYLPPASESGNLPPVLDNDDPNVGRRMGTSCTTHDHSEEMLRENHQESLVASIAQIPASFPIAEFEFKPQLASTPIASYNNDWRRGLNRSATPTWFARHLFVASNSPRPAKLAS